MQTAAHHNSTPHNHIPLHLNVDRRRILASTVKINKRILSSFSTETEKAANDAVVPYAVSANDLYASGYSWRGICLTRQDLLCLLIFVQKMDNRNTALVLGLSIGTVHKRSSRLRCRLGFESKRAMVKAAQQAGFMTIFPNELIESLFDELKQRKAAQKAALGSKE